MDVDLIFKVAAIGLLAAVINILLQRSGRDEQALMTTIAALVVRSCSRSAAYCSCPAAPR